MGRRTGQPKDLFTLMSEPKRVQQDGIRTVNCPATPGAGGWVGLPELRAFNVHNSGFLKRTYVIPVSGVVAPKICVSFTRGPVSDTTHSWRLVAATVRWGRVYATRRWSRCITARRQLVTRDQSLCRYGSSRYVNEDSKECEHCA